MIHRRGSSTTNTCLARACWSRRSSRNGASRQVYLPPGAWIDYQTGKAYEGAKWHEIKPANIPVVLLVKNHSVLPQLKVAQSTPDIDWNDVELRVFSTDNAPVTGWFALPDGELKQLELNGSASGYAMKGDPLAGSVKWQINRVPLK